MSNQPIVCSCGHVPHAGICGVKAVGTSAPPCACSTPAIDTFVFVEPLAEPGDTIWQFGCSLRTQPDEGDQFSHMGWEPFSVDDRHIWWRRQHRSVIGEANDLLNES